MINNKKCIPWKQILSDILTNCYFTCASKFANTTHFTNEQITKKNTKRNEKIEKKFDWMIADIYKYIALWYSSLSVQKRDNIFIWEKRFTAYIYVWIVNHRVFVERAKRGQWGEMWNINNAFRDLCTTVGTYIYI